MGLQGESQREKNVSEKGRQEGVGGPGGGGAGALGDDQKPSPFGPQ
jgi:hypothetical protein